MMRIALLVIVFAAAAPARADTCATLDGDPSLVRSIGAELAERGIGHDTDCARVAHVERRGGELVISIANITRTVRGVGTAATVIESFVREDVGSPLLAIRAVERPEVAIEEKNKKPPDIAQPAPLVGGRSGWHLFAGLESSLASDGTGWGGMQLGACVMLGPFCAGARLRGTAVASEDAVWGMLHRKSSEALLGVDIPFSIGRFLLMPGVAAGWGGVTTKDTPESRSRSNNFRAQLHTSFSIPITSSLAIDIYVAGTLVQQVEREPGYMDALPDEPYGFLRAGVGVRYGRR